MRKKYLVDRNFQFRFALQMALFVVVVPFLVWVNVFVLGLQTFDREALAEAARTDSGFVGLVLSRQWVLMVAVYGLSLAAVYFLIVYHSHRIAGPVYRFAQALKKISEGDLTQQVKLRKHDFLQELGIEINRLAQAQGNTVTDLRTAVRSLKNLNQSLNNASLGKEIDRLESLLAQFRVSER